MARVYGPLFSLDARGQVGRAIVYSIWKGLNYVRRYLIPENPATALQTKIRGILSMAVDGWHYVLSAAQRTAWEDDSGRPDGQSGFNWYVSEYIQAMWAGTTPPEDPP